jgi:hypothetical protein
LDEFVAKLATFRPGVQDLRDWELVGALVVAADRSPIEAVRAVVGTYKDTERELQEAVEVVCRFLLAHAPSRH